MKFWGRSGAFWGGLWGTLFGAVFFAIPGISPVLVAGPLVAWIVGALKGTVVVGGLSAPGAELCSIGIPNRLLKNSCSVSFRGANGDEESRKCLIPQKADPSRSLP